MISRYQQQKGVALLTVLMVVVLATIAAVAMTSRQQVDIRRTENILRNEQAILYLLAAEDYGRQFLSLDFRNSTKDYLDEDWAKAEGKTYPVENAMVSGRIEDLQGRFNLNSLMNGGAIDTENYERFKRLLSLLDLPVAIADAVVDWLDANQNVQLLGAEDVFYQGLTYPHRTGDTEMVSPSELLYLPLPGDDVYQLYLEKLKPYVCTLPGNTPININTVQYPEIIAALAPGISKKAASDWLAERDVGSYDLNSFIKHPMFSGKLKKTGLSVSSQYFLLEAHVSLGESYAWSQSLVKRLTDKDIRVLQRIQGEI